MQDARYILGNRAVAVALLVLGMLFIGLSAASVGSPDRTIATETEVSPTVETTPETDASEITTPEVTTTETAEPTPEPEATDPAPVPASVLNILASWSLPDMQPETLGIQYHTGIDPGAHDDDMDNPGIQISALPDDLPERRRIEHWLVAEMTSGVAGAVVYSPAGVLHAELAVEIRGCADLGHPTTPGTALESATNTAQISQVDGEYIAGCASETLRVFRTVSDLSAADPTGEYRVEWFIVDEGGATVSAVTYFENLGLPTTDTPEPTETVAPVDPSTPTPEPTSVTEPAATPSPTPTPTDVDTFTPSPVTPVPEATPVPSTPVPAVETNTPVPTIPAPVTNTAIPPSSPSPVTTATPTPADTTPALPVSTSVVTADDAALTEPDDKTSSETTRAETQTPATPAQTNPTPGTNDSGPSEAAPEAPSETATPVTSDSEPGEPSTPALQITAAWLLPDMQPGTPGIQYGTGENPGQRDDDMLADGIQTSPVLADGSEVRSIEFWITANVPGSVASLVDARISVYAPDGRLHDVLPAEVRSCTDLGQPSSVGSALRAATETEQLNPQKAEVLASCSSATGVVLSAVGILSVTDDIGMYGVESLLIDELGASDMAVTRFENLAVTGLEINVDRINFGDVQPGAWTAATPEANPGLSTVSAHTVHNTGNVSGFLTLTFSPMSGSTGSSEGITEFGVALGTEEMMPIEAGVSVCFTQEIEPGARRDLRLLVYPGMLASGNYEGTLTLSLTRSCAS